MTRPQTLRYPKTCRIWGRITGHCVIFFQTDENAIHKRVFDSLLQKNINTPSSHNLVVDDTLVADTQRHILTFMPDSIKYLFIIFEEMYEFRSRSPLAWISSPNSNALGKSSQLWLTINNQYIPLFFPDAKLKRLHLIIPSMCHSSTKGFIPLGCVTLLSFLKHVSIVCTWSHYLHCTLQGKVNNGLRY